MSPRPIHMPLSGGDRSNFKKSLKAARDCHALWSHQASMKRTRGEAMVIAGEENIREAEFLECKAWNAIMFCGGPASPSPSIGAAIRAGFYRLLIKCNRCGREHRLDLRELKRKDATPVHHLEAALFCEPCSDPPRYRQRAYILWLVEPEDMPPDPAPDEKRQRT